MARLVIQSEGFDNRVILLNLGVNHFGRSPENEFCIEHPTVSNLHCEIEMKVQGLLVRDCGSTNGTFLDGATVRETMLAAGQILRLGEVELRVEDALVSVAIPRIEVQMPAPPVVRNDGSIMCRRHEDIRATYRCTHCREMLCDTCVHKLRRRKGKTLLLCPLCSHPVEPVVQVKPKKKTIMSYLVQTVKIPFAKQRREDD